MRRFIFGVLMVLLVTTAAFSQQPTEPAPTAPPTAPALQTPAPAPTGPILEDGTPLTLKIGRTVSSADAHVGDTVDFWVVDEVKVGNTVVIPKGSTAWATIVDAKPKRRLARGGRLKMSFESVRLATGDKAPLRAVQTARGGGHEGAMTGGIVATGIVFFPAAPFFLFMHGRDITVPMGTEATAYIHGNVPLDLARFAPPAARQEAAANATEAILDITCNPDGAEIELDGNFVGNAPTSLSVAAGDHTLKLTKGGYAAWEKKIKTSSGKVTITAELQPATPPAAPPEPK